MYSYFQPTSTYTTTEQPVSITLKEINNLRKKFKAEKAKLDALAKAAANEEVTVTIKLKVADLKNYERVLSDINGAYAYDTTPEISASVVNPRDRVQVMRQQLESAAQEAVKNACSEILNIFPKFKKLNEKYNSLQSDIEQAHSDIDSVDYEDFMYQLDCLEEELKQENE